MHDAHPTSPETRIVVVGYEPGEVVGPFADRHRAYAWIMREHATNGLNDFDILEMRAPEPSPDEPRRVGEGRDPLPLDTRLKWLDMFGIDPDYCGGKSVDEFLEESRGEA